MVKRVLTLASFWSHVITTTQLEQSIAEITSLVMQMARNSHVLKIQELCAGHCHRSSMELGMLTSNAQKKLLVESQRMPHCQEASLSNSTQTLL